MTEINIAIIEDDDQYRTDFEAFCRSSPQLNCMLAVDSAEKLIKYYPSQATLDIIIVDIDLPGISGIEAIKFIKRLSSEVDIIMLTVFNDYDNTFKAIRAGAVGYLLKNLTFEAIENHLITCKETGGVPLSPQIARRVLAYFQPKKSVLSLNEKKIALTPKETLVIKHLVNGKTYKEAAAELGITVSGVRFHIKNIYQKLHINSRSELMHLYFNKLLPR